MRTLLAAVLLVISHPVRSQFGTQLLLDTATTTPYVIGATTASNGDAMFICQGHNGFSSIRRHAPDGTPVWSKDYATNGSPTGLSMLMPDASGGFFAARQRATYTQSSDISDIDTTYLEFDFASLTENGGVVWARTLRTQRIGFMLHWENIARIQALRMPNDEIVLITRLQESAGLSRILLIRLSADGGQVLYAKQFGHSGLQDPWLETSPWSMMTVLDAGDGGLLISTPTTEMFGYGHPYVVKFDAQGDWTWAKSIQYGTSVNSQSTQAMAMGPNGEILIHHEVSAPGGKTLIHRLNPAGEWLRSDLYSDQQWVASDCHFQRIASGGFVIVKTTGSVLLVNDDASLIGFYGHPASVFADQSYYGNFRHARVEGNHLHLHGTFIGTHQVFGNIGSWPLYERFDLTAPLEGCNVTDVPAQHYPVPANLITATSETPPPTVDIANSIELSTASWATTDLSELPPLDLCVFIEELGVGVEEATSTSTIPMLRSNIVLADGGMDAIIPAEGMLELRDSLGRLVATQRVAARGPATFQAPSIPGHYLLSWISSDGFDRRSERLVVQ